MPQPHSTANDLLMLMKSGREIAQAQVGGCQSSRGAAGGDESGAIPGATPGQCQGKHLPQQGGDGMGATSEGKGQVPVWGSARGPWQGFGTILGSQGAFSALQGATTPSRQAAPIPGQGSALSSCQPPARAGAHSLPRCSLSGSMASPPKTQGIPVPFPLSPSQGQRSPGGLEELGWQRKGPNDGRGGGECQPLPGWGCCRPRGALPAAGAPTAGQEEEAEEGSALGKWELS